MANKKVSVFDKRPEFVEPTKNSEKMAMGNFCAFFLIFCVVILFFILILNDILKIFFNISLQ